MSTALFSPDNCLLVLIDPQAGLAYGGSREQSALNANVQALAQTAKVFDIPTVVTNSSHSNYEGEILPIALKVFEDIQPVHRQSMNAWDEPEFRQRISQHGRRRLLIAGLLTEACVTFPALSALAEGYDVYIVGDCCGGMTLESHNLALQRLAGAGARMTSWMQVLLELQRDWNHTGTYASAKEILEEFGGGYGVGLWYTPA